MPLYEMVMILRAQCKQRTKAVLLDMCDTLYGLECHLTDIKMISGTALPYVMTTKTREKLTHGLYFTFKLYGTPHLRQELTAKLKYNPDVIRNSIVKCNLDGDTSL